MLPKLGFLVWKYTIWQPWFAPIGTVHPTALVLCRIGSSNPLPYLKIINCRWELPRLHIFSPENRVINRKQNDRIETYRNYSTYLSVEASSNCNIIDLCLEVKLDCTFVVQNMFVVICCMQTVGTADNSCIGKDTFHFATTYSKLALKWRKNWWQLKFADFNP
jgi:hypothetical protein